MEESTGSHRQGERGSLPPSLPPRLEQAGARGGLQGRRGAAPQPTSEAGLRRHMLWKELTVATGLSEEEPGVTERKTGRGGGRGGIA